MPRCTPSWIAILDRFLIDFCFQLRPTGSQKSWFILRKIHFFENTPFEVNIEFWSHFELNLALFWHPKSTKILPKSIPRGTKKLINFGIDFLLILAALWGPTWNHVGHLSRPKTVQEASKTLPRRLQDASKTVQDASKDALDRPRRPKTPPKTPRSPPGLDFSRCLIDV